ncbi:Protein CBG25772 [Caenorhabditis briggsae]|uniref:Protein CBG25772 n=1 Tax=Caenorhabditis briggsae TaxID=6238 RepID=B6IGJ5_CAEBR|nr:Protein CBG25772 [Caenorhabditis briggsae]CAR99025.1 Protein CBG25772 [Caenorhabditis briggsae]
MFIEYQFGNRAQKKANWVFQQITKKDALLTYICCLCPLITYLMTQTQEWRALFQRCCLPVNRRTLTD